MKRVFVALMFSGLVLYVHDQASAQGPGRGGWGSDSARVEQTVTNLQELLALDSGQVVKVREIVTANIKQMRKDRESLTGDRAAMREAMGKDRDAADKKIEALLTEKQKQGYAKFKKDREEQMRQRMERPRSE